MSLPVLFHGEGFHYARGAQVEFYESVKQWKAGDGVGWGAHVGVENLHKSKHKGVPELSGGRVAGQGRALLL